MPDFFHTNEANYRAALEFTTAEFGFQPALIEKDYFCSLVLNELSRRPELTLVFKGGTLLNKAYAGFYRLSEDLDFTIPTEKDSTRSQRSRVSKKIEIILEQIVSTIPGLSIREPLTGFNNSTQYQCLIGYHSIMGGSGNIRFEISQREMVVMGVERPILNTLLVDALTGDVAVPPFGVRALSMREAYAEKVRAALTRRVPAIRDLFDLDHATRNDVLDFNDPELLPLIVKKIQQPGNEIFALDASRSEAFRDQLESGLKPVLRMKDFRSFNFNQAIGRLRTFEEAIKTMINQN